MPEISIIIVNYNVKDFLLQCIHSIKKYLTTRVFEIIEIDNNSSDGSCDALLQEFRNDVTLIENKINVGFSAANNQGIKSAKGELIFLLNPDCELFDNSIELLFDYVKAETVNVIAAPCLRNSDKTFQSSCFRFPGVLQIILESFMLHSIINIKTYSQKEVNENNHVDALSGASLLFKSELTDSIGLLDEELFWMEDIDFCFRNVKAGGKNIYFPHSAIIHHGSRSAVKNYNVAISNQIISKLKYISKHDSSIEFFIAMFFSWFHITTRIIGFGILLLLSSENLLKMKAYVFAFKKLWQFMISER